MNEPASPCRNRCQMDAASGLCAGCARSLDEIANWSRLDAPAKRAVLAQLPQRQQTPLPKQENIKMNTTTTPPATPVYVCIGICTTDPESGYCIGCGRPPETSPPLEAVTQNQPSNAGEA